MKCYSLREIAEEIGGKLEGDGDFEISRVMPPDEAIPGDLTLVLEHGNRSQLEASSASAFVIPESFSNPGRNVIRVAEPRRALIDLLQLFVREEPIFPGIDARAIVSPRAELGAEAVVGAGAFVESGARLGRGCKIFPGVYVGQVEMGDDCVIYPGVCLYSNTRLGNRVIIHAGTVIGSDGFGYLQDPEGRHLKIPQVGGVEIGDDVEIGANCTIDRATIGMTRIQSGTKIDNLVQIGHNTRIGKNGCIIAQVGISGSVEIGDNCTLAGQVGVRDHVRLDHNVTIGAKSGVDRDLKSGRYVGYPALPAKESFQVYSLLARLPEMRRQIRRLEKRCEELETELEKKSAEWDRLD